jgi:glutamyl/glutaminyl-tRNA synthetase
VWGVAGVVGARVQLRIDDHDRVRSRPEYDAAVLEDLAWLGFAADRGPVRHSDSDTPYRDAVEVLRAQGLVYGCSCSRTTFAAWAKAAGRPWVGGGCPGGCRDRALEGPVLRAAIGEGTEAWSDTLAGPCSGDVAIHGDLPLRDRDGNWSYGLTVVVDDLEGDIDMVVRGRDLIDATPAQIRLGRLLGRPAPPAFLHHPLIQRADGSKLSKSAGDTAVRELRAAGRSPVEVRALAASRGQISMFGEPDEQSRRTVTHNV